MEMDMCYFGPEKKRYETRGIKTNLPIEYRLLLWLLIDDMRENVKMDYLQIFKFYVEKNEAGILVQRITHCQEVEKFSHTYEFQLGDVWLRENVYVIDDGEQCTMLWASEY